MQRRKLTVLLLALVTLVAVVAAGCGKKQEQAASPTPGETETTTPVAGDGPVEVVVTMTDFKIEPATITVSQGATVRLVVKNDSSANPHDFSIPDLNAATKQLAGNESETITFTADKTGTFKILCTVPGHEALGMKGELKVQ